MYFYNISHSQDPITTPNYNLHISSFSSSSSSSPFSHPSSSFSSSSSKNKIKKCPNQSPNQSQPLKTHVPSAPPNAALSLRPATKPPLSRPYSPNPRAISLSHPAAASQQINNTACRLLPKSSPMCKDRARGPDRASFTCTRRAGGASTSG